MSRHAIALAVSCALFACTDSAGGPGGDPGGKADDPASCNEPDRNCLDTRKYEVLFTNPVCAELAYDEPIFSADGGTLIATKPKNVYCTRDDAPASAARENAPEKRLLDWITPLGEGDELFLAYLSYSNRVVGDALCQAAERGVDITFVLDRPTDRSNELEDCGGTVLIRGHQGSVGFAHVKLIMINPNGPGPADADEQFMRLSFGSGNMSSGTVLHHENWHFLEVNRDSFFVEAHRCLIQGLLDPALTDGKTPFRTFMNECREAIELLPEDDIQSFFIPVLEDSRAVTELVEDGIADAETVDIGAHRFGWRQMLDALIERLETDDQFELRLVADDDLYWLRPLVGSPTQVGPNDFFEADNVDDLSAAGGQRFEVRYMETNHSLHFLHHNKFIIYNNLPGRPDAVLTGSPNLTGTGFKDNLENVYWIEIPSVIEAYRQQYDKFWEVDATRPNDMPSEDITLRSEDAVEGGETLLLINEILADPPSGFDANGDGSASTLEDEFVEIVNLGRGAVDLSGATVSDALAVRATLPDGLRLEPGQVLVIFGGGSPTDLDGAIAVAGAGSLSLNNAGDTVTLVGADGDVLATETYGSSSDESLVRASDADPSAALVPHSSVGSGPASPGTRSDGSSF